MTEELEKLAQCPLFEGIRPEDRKPMLACLGARMVSVSKNQVIFHE